MENSSYDENVEIEIVKGTAVEFVNYELFRFFCWFFVYLLYQPTCVTHRKTDAGTVVRREHEHSFLRDTPLLRLQRYADAGWMDAQGNDGR